MQNNIRELLNSKRFWTSVATFVAMVAVSLIPSLEGQEQQLIDILALLGLALVTGFTITDTAEANAAKNQ